MLDMCAKVVELSATFEQTYADVIREFVDYANQQPKLIRLDFLEACAEDFIKIKMERWKCESTN